MKFFKALNTRPPGLVLSSKTLIIMRLIVFLIVVASFQASAAGAQLVTISRKNASLLTIFQDIRQQTGYSFVFNQAWLSQTKPVTVEVKNATLKDALDIAFQDQPFTYDITDKIISLKEKVKGMSTGTTIEDPDPVINVHGKVVGEDGKPLEGITIMVKGSSQIAKTNENGEFTLHGASIKSVLFFSSVNTEFYEYRINGRSEVQVSLKKKTTEMGQVSVELSNGYERVNKERATGAFSYIDSSLINREVSTNILDRVKNNMTGIYSAYASIPATANTFSSNPGSRSLGITIRGISTLSSFVTTDPLIVVDGFPYMGDISNINPNDVESITELKDAAAASIWGAQAGNGVLVLTTKKGRLNKGMLVDFTTNLTVVDKTNLLKNPNYLSTNDYINVEDTLFTKGYYNARITSTSQQTGLTPVVQILLDQRNGLISAAQAQNQIDALRRNDFRKDFMKYVEQKAVNQQYSIGMRGGNEQTDYSIRFGYDNNRGSLIRNGSSRITLNANTTFRPIKNLEITGALLFAQSELVNDDNVSSNYYPYARLKNPDGTPAAITTQTYRESYIDSLQKIGFIDWHYRPLDEIKNTNFTTKTNDWVFRVGVRYHFLPFLSAEVQYENEQQIVANSQLYNDSSYYARNLINQFTQYSPSTQTFTYVFPVGGILSASNLVWNNYTYRGQLSFNKSMRDLHSVTAIVGAEQRQMVTSINSSVSYGYNPDLGTSTNILDYTTAYPTNPGGRSQLPAPATAGAQGQTLRYLSYYGNAAYTYKQRYTLSGSAREDGSNIFGVNINKKFSPLWSTGISWEVSRENFYHTTLIPYLKVRATYGFNGNVYNGSAYVTGGYDNASVTGIVDIAGLNAPNQDLSWEKVKNINLGIDFSIKKSILYGSADFYIKEGQDLVEPISLAPSVGFDSYYGNAASTQTKGIELTLNSNIINRKFKWHVALIGNFLGDKVTRWDVPITSSTFRSNGIVAIKGKPLFSVFAYKWAGLDPTNGDPQGYLNGKVSKDYTSIINNYKPDSLQFIGSGRPTKWGSLRNDFSYAGFTLSAMLTYHFGSYFRRPSISGNLTDVIAGNAIGFKQRWQKPGDERITNVPSEVYPSNTNRATFYTYSAAVVTKGDLIRFQDIRLSYNLSQIVKSNRFSGIEVYSYANNLGLIWKSNKWHLDPDSYIPVPFSISFGVKASFK